MQLHTKLILNGFLLCIFSAAIAQVPQQQPDHKQSGLKTKNILSNISSLLNSIKTAVDEVEKDEETLEKIDHVVSQVKNEAGEIVKKVVENIPKEKLIKAKQACKEEFEAADKTIMSTLNVLEEELSVHSKKLKNGLTEILGQETVQKIKTEVETSAKKIEHKFKESNLQENLEKLGAKVEEKGQTIEKPLTELEETLEKEYKETFGPLEKKLNITS